MTREAEFRGALAYLTTFDPLFQNTAAKMFLFTQSQSIWPNAPKNTTYKQWAWVLKHEFLHAIQEACARSDERHRRWRIRDKVLRRGLAVPDWLKEPSGSSLWDMATDAEINEDLKGGEHPDS